MLRKIITIDEEKCNGCGLCVSACHEGAIGLIAGKAVLLRDDYCDGLGNCLPLCPTGAIGFEEREALAYNEKEVIKNMVLKENEQNKNNAYENETLPCGCPGTEIKTIQRETPLPTKEPQVQTMSSQLAQWPIQIKLVPVNAPYFDDAHLLVAADCAAYTYGNFHNDFMRKRITLIGCPKLDNEDYSKKLTDILRANNIKSVTVVRMEVPCCGGIVEAVKTALMDSGEMIPWQIVTVSTDGNLLD